MEELPENLPKIPLELSKSAQKVGFRLDRKKYKAIWEIGRARTVSDRDLWFGLKAAADQAAHEADLLGLKSDEVWMTAHAPNEYVKRLHERDYGLHELEKHPDGPGHLVMGAKLSEFRAAIEKKIKKFNPEIEEFSHPEDHYSSFQKRSDFNIPIQNEKVYFRNFKAYVEAGKAAPTTWIEFFSGKDGAKSPLLKKFEQTQGGSVDFELYQRMFEYYSKHTPNWENLKYPAWVNHDSFLKSRFQQERALVIDDARTLTNQTIQWDSVLKQAVTYAKENNIQKIAIPWHDLNPQLSRIPHQTENIYFAEGPWQDFGFFKLQAKHLFDLSIHWFNVEDVERILGSKKLEIPSMRDRFWSEPLYSVE